MNININCESSLRVLLKNKGFITNEKHESENGIDIVAIKDGHYFLIEVKKIVDDKTGARIRSDNVSGDCDFILVIGLKGQLYPKEIMGKPYSKIVRFMEMIG